MLELSRTVLYTATKPSLLKVTDRCLIATGALECNLLTVRTTAVQKICVSNSQRYDTKMYLDEMFEGFTKLSDLDPYVRSQHHTAAFIAVVNTRDTAQNLMH